MDNDSELPIQYFDFKHSDKNSDIFSFHQSHASASDVYADHQQIQNANISTQGMQLQYQFKNTFKHLCQNKSQHQQSQKEYEEGQKQIQSQSRSIPNITEHVVNHLNNKKFQQAAKPTDQSASKIYSFTSQEAEEYFNMLFSPKTVAEYLIRRNQCLQMKNFDNSQSEISGKEQQVYKKRKERVSALNEKQKKNWKALLEIKKNDTVKYQELIKFMQLLAEVKGKINGIRHDYYSQKTFLTLTKVNSTDIQRLTKIFSKILQKVISQYLRNQNQFKPEEKNLTQVYQEFLILPRFLISKQKLLRFIKDQILQQNFTYLISHTCLGHYNNQANKKLPQEGQMKYVRQLLLENNGKERFKRICGINHGGKFIKRYGKHYYELYDKSIQCLKNLDAMCRKNCQFQDIQKQFACDQDRKIKAKRKAQQKLEMEMSPNRQKQQSLKNGNSLFLDQAPRLQQSKIIAKGSTNLMPKPTFFIDMDPYHRQNQINRQNSVSNQNLNFRSNFILNSHLKQSRLFRPSLNIVSVVEENEASQNGNLEPENSKTLLDANRQINSSDHFNRANNPIGQTSINNNAFGSKCKIKRFYSLADKFGIEQDLEQGQNQIAKSGYNFNLSSIKKNSTDNQQIIFSLNKAPPHQQSRDQIVSVQIGQSNQQNIQELQCQKQHQRKQGFRLKRWYTMESERERNIIIVQPPCLEDDPI